MCFIVSENGCLLSVIIMLHVCVLLCVCQKHDLTVAIKCITKKNLAKSQNLLSKEINILKVCSICLPSMGCHYYYTPFLMTSPCHAFVNFNLE